MHLSWLDPQKERRFTVVGSDRMATFDDMALERKVTIYDKGVDPPIRNYGEYITRSGDVTSPQISNEEPLRIECRHFVECVRDGRESRAPAGASGLRAVRVLEALQRSLEAGGVPQALEPAGGAAFVKHCVHPSDLAPGLMLGHDVELGEDIELGAWVVIHSGTVVGDGCELQDGAVLGKRPRLGARSRPRAILLASAAGRQRGAVVCAGAVVYAGARARRRGAIVGDQTQVRERAVVGAGAMIGRGCGVDNDVADRRTGADSVELLSGCSRGDRGGRVFRSRRGDHQRRPDGPSRARRGPCGDLASAARRVSVCWAWGLVISPCG